MELAVPSRRPAATSTRVAAALIDLVVSLSLTAVVALLVFALGVRDAPELAFFLARLIDIPYEVGLTAWIGQTVGKRAVKVVVVDTADRVPTLGRSLLRYFVKALPGVSLVVTSGFAAFLLGLYPIALLVSIATNPERRGWHDRVAGTWVMEEQGRRSMTQELADGVPQVPIIEP